MLSVAISYNPLSKSCTNFRAMPQASRNPNPREVLKHELQSSTSPLQLEKLSAALLGHLLGLPIKVARAGFQYGADAGPAGEQNRRLRLECKRYKDGANLNERELLGEIDQALYRDEALEAWVLIVTCSVSEQVHQSLIQHGEKNGIPIVILDWSDNANVPVFAALCACNPSLVRDHLSEKAGIAATTLQSISEDEIEKLRRNLQSWCLGFESLRAASHERLNKIWNSSQAAQALFMQNVAGGETEKKVKRELAHQSLDSWWHMSTENLSPAIIAGPEGVGKTWATVNWLIDSTSELPIILTIPSSAVSSGMNLSEMGIKQLIADNLYEISSTRNREHWLRRLDRLLEDPTGERPVLLIFFDGLNQNPSIDWASILKIFQSELFAKHVRIVCSTRKHYYEERLFNLRELPNAGKLINVEPFDTEPSGELDQMLRFEDLNQSDLHPDVIELARNPRLFGLVISLKETLASSGQITIHRILWEYGKDTLGVHSGRVFSENDWEGFLKKVAQHYRNGIHQYSHQSLSEAVYSPDLTAQEVYARLSNIIDGEFATRNQSGDWQITHTIVAQALGLGLFHYLEGISPSNYETLNNELCKWLEPIEGFDEQAEVLRAAVSIAVAQNRASEMPVSGVLLTAWLQSQNLTDEHRQEIVKLASNFPEALLIAIGQSTNQAQTSARDWAVKALRTVPRTDTKTRDHILKYACDWMKTVSLNNDVYLRQAINADLGLGTDVPSENPHSEWFIKRIKTDVPGLIKIAGVEIELVNVASGVLSAVVPSIIQGFPLVHFRPLFEIAAVARAITLGEQSECWKGLKWLCLFNREDPDDTTGMLRNLSEDIRNRVPEPNLHPKLPDHIAGFLLWMTGQEKDSETADSLALHLDFPTYEDDYLPDPNRSLFPLEKRHVKNFLTDTTLPLGFRARRISELWADPTFTPPTIFIEEIRLATNSIDVTKLGQHQGNTDENFLFSDLEPVLARYAPDLLADLMRRKVQSMKNCSAENRRWCASEILDHFILIGEEEKEAINALRLGDQHENSDIEDQISNYLLLAEVRDLEAFDQLDLLIGNSLKHIRRDFAAILNPPSSDDIDELISRYSRGSEKQQYDLLTLLSIYPTELSTGAWTWAMGFIHHQDNNIRGMTFQILTCSDPGRFGKVLKTENWSWESGEDDRVNHYGSDALAYATRSLPFDEIATRLAPWRLLRSVQLRGSEPSEVRLAALILDQILNLGIKEPDLSAKLSIDYTRPKTHPYSYTVSLMPSSEPYHELILATNHELRISLLEQAINSARSCIREAHALGASLYLQRVEPEDFKLIIQHDPNLIQKWIEGSCEISEDFLHRVRMAEGTYMALCEALLAHDPRQGMQLWHALRMCSRMQHSGIAGIADLLHMIFRAPDSAGIVSLQEKLTETEYCRTDHDLFEFALSASHNGQSDWLDGIIEQGRASPIAWHRYRAVVLCGFTTRNELPIADAWPEGRLKSSHAHLNHHAARHRWREACAHHWWQAFLDATDLSQVYAFWVLFLHSADRRAQLLIDQFSREQNNLLSFKLKHIVLNRSRLENAFKKRENKLVNKFLDRNISDNIYPWIV